MVLTMHGADSKKKNPDLSAGAKIINHSSPLQPEMRSEAHSASYGWRIHIHAARRSEGQAFLVSSYE